MKRILRSLLILALLAFVVPVQAADVDLGVQTMSVSGLAGTYNGSLSTSNTYHVRNDGKTILHFKKSGATNATITFTTPGTVGGIAIADPTITVLASTGDNWVGPFAPGIFNDGNGDLLFTASNITGLTVAIYRLP